MSSLLQFDGETGRKGVRLQFTYPSKFIHCPEDLRAVTPHDQRVIMVECDPVPCPACATKYNRPAHYHARIYRAWRMPCGMFGPWVVFRYNGTTHVPDLSIPITVDVMPRDAVPCSDTETIALWHSS